MKLHYLIPDRFGKYDLDKRPSADHPGGGLATKARRAIEAWNLFYDAEATEELYPYLTTVIVDPSWFRWRGDSKEIEDCVLEYERHPATTKILYSTEISLLEIDVSLRNRIVEASSVVTTPCEWLRSMYQTQNIESVHLCDPVPEEVFYNPNSAKTVSVVGMSRISTEKNSEMVLEVFKQLEGKQIERIYIGSADLWGSKDKIDSDLEHQIRNNCDTFHRNLSQPELAKKLESIGCGIFDTYHETGSESNLEASMAGVISFYGTHGLWDERPGIKGLYTVDGFVEAIAQETNNFRRPPLKSHRQKAEQWALDNCSYDQFLTEWKEVRKYASSQ